MQISGGVYFPTGTHGGQLTATTLIQWHLPTVHSPVPSPVTCRVPPASRLLIGCESRSGTGAGAGTLPRIFID